MKRKILFLLTVVGIMVGLSACSDKNKVAETTAEEKDEVIKIVCVGDATTEACKEVSEKASKITQEKLGVDVELVRLGYGSFVQEVNLMLSSGEKVDLIPSFGMGVMNAANSGQILPLDDLLDKYGQGIKEIVPDEEFRCTTVNGNIYAVPNNKEKVQGFGYAMRKDMLEATGIDVSDIKTDEDMEKVFEKIKELYPNTYPLVSDGGDMSQPMCTRDDLGGDFGCLEDGLNSNDTTVVNWYETETYRNMMHKRYEWANKGWIMPDASSSTEGAYSLIAAGQGFAYLTNTKPGIDSEWSRKVGKEMVVVETVEPMATTTGVANQWFIPHCSTNPEKAMQVLNEMYTNPELSNLFINGIEGEHYQVLESGLLGYPEGVDAANTTYSSVAWVWPNELISTPWEVDGPDIWKDTQKFNENAKKSIGMGFVWDNSKVLNELTACNNVIAKYGKALNCGSLEPDETIDRMLKELKDAGVDRVVDEKKRQFEEWLETSK